MRTMHLCCGRGGSLWTGAILGWDSRWIRRYALQQTTAGPGTGIRLTPTFAEWWMGWPLGASAMMPEASASLPSETRGSRSRQRSPGACSEGR